MTRSIESLLQSRRIHQGEQFGRKARDDVTRIIRAARYSVGGDPSELTGQFDRIEDGEMVEGRNRLGDAESADSPEGYADASGADLATQHTFNEVAGADGSGVVVEENCKDQ